MPIDIRSDHLQIVENILKKHVPDYKVLVFGSRAKWTAKDTSDLDLCIKGDTPLSLELLAHLRDDFSESNLPYKVDVVDWYGLSDEFREVVERDGMKLLNADVWKVMSLDEAVEINPSIKMTKGEQFPFVDMHSIIIGNRNVYASKKRVFSGSGAKFKDGDTLMARITPCLENGKIARYRNYNQDKPAHGSTEFIVLRNKNGITHNRFIYYLTISDFIKPKAIAQMTGSSGRQRVSPDSLGRIILKIPSIQEQESISEVLEALDDKIELNRKMNITLEATAQAIFKSWFVDFDPVRAKTEGRKPGGLSDDIAALFPDKLVESSLGMTPEGWEVKSLGEVTDILRRGITPIYVESGGVRVINQKCIRNQFVNFVHSRRHDSTKKNILESLLKGGDVLINSTGVGTLGRVAQIWKISEDTIADGHITIARQNCFITRLMLGYNLVSKEREIEKLGHGSTGQTELSRTDLGKLEILVPTKPIQEMFDSVVWPVIEKIYSNSIQLRLLSKLRDSLLPKLISGELRIGDIVN